MDAATENLVEQAARFTVPTGFPHRKQYVVRCIQNALVGEEKQSVPMLEF